MSEGMSRRDLIKASAIAGAAAWTAPVLFSSSASAAEGDTVCAGVKISSCSSINVGTVALCPNFETTSLADFTNCVAPACDTYDPHFGFFFKICGPVVTNLLKIAVKWSGNAKTCSNTGSQNINWNAAGCATIDKSPSGFPTTAYTSFSEASWATCGTGVPATGNMIEMSAVNGTFVNVAAGINAPAAGPGNRWLFLNAPGNLNEIGLAICSVLGSLPPTCPDGSCTAA